MRPAFFVTAALALTLATPTLAQSQLERLETATEAASQNMADFMTTRAPQLAAVMPDFSWDDDMRAAATCTLDAIRAEAGDAAIETYIAEVEAFSTTPITSLLQMGEITPVPVNADFAQSVGMSCGTAELAIQQMQESGLMQAMMDPAVMEVLMGN